MFKKIIKSKTLKLFVTLVLIYFAFRKVDIGLILSQLKEVNIFALIFWLLISVISTILLAYRWGLLLIKRPKLDDIVVFSKSIWSATFYGLFVPSGAAGDVFKWIIIDEKYPHIPKSKLGASILLDRFVGMSMLIFFGFISQFFANRMGVQIPFVIRIIFGLIFLGCLIFYGLVFAGRANLIFDHKWLVKIKSIGELVNKENSTQILKCLGVSLISDLLWIWQMWTISNYFGANLTFIEILIFLPVISTILILPISIAGFGAREQLYLYFFVKQITSPESILLTSAISGIIGILNSLLGGLVTLTPEYKKPVRK